MTSHYVEQHSRRLETKRHFFVHNYAVFYVDRLSFRNQISKRNYLNLLD
jgi:hypothetical protein